MMRMNPSHKPIITACLLTTQRKSSTRNGFISQSSLWPHNAFGYLKSDICFCILLMKMHRNTLYEPVLTTKAPKSSAHYYPDTFQLVYAAGNLIIMTWYDMLGNEFQFEQSPSFWLLYAIMQMFTSPDLNINDGDCSAVLCQCQFSGQMLKNKNVISCLSMLNQFIILLPIEINTSVNTICPEKISGQFQ